jgi:hypothetical protein
MKKVLRFRQRLAVRLFDKTEPPKAIGVLRDISEPLASAAPVKGQSRRRWKSPHVRKKSPRAAARKSPAKGKSPRKTKG